MRKSTVDATRRAVLGGGARLLGAATLARLVGPSPLSAAAADPALANLSAHSAVEAMRKGEISAETYAKAALDRAQALARLNAFRVLEPEQVLDAARAADKARAAGATLGPLHGLPVPVKDSVDTKDWPTSYGSPALRDFRPKADASIVARLRQAGAIVMGKTNLHELSFGWTSNNTAFGPVHNPYDPSRIPGGSSGGSAAAVAARIAPLAVAEDTWASIRLPAAYCGLAGLRPTYGHYPDEGIMPLSNHFDQVGPVARTVSDITLFNHAVTGESAVTPTSLAGAQLGVPRRLWEGADPEIARLCEEGLRRLRDAGAILVEVTLPETSAAAPEIAVTIIGYEAPNCIGNFLAHEGAAPTFEEVLAAAGGNVKAAMASLALPPHRPPSAAHAAALAKRETLKRDLAAFVTANRLSALLFPAALCPPPKIGEENEVTIAGRKVPLSEAVGRNTALGSVVGGPSLILPAGLTAAHLPVGLEVLALPGQDRALLALGLALEHALGSVPPPKI